MAGQEIFLGKGLMEGGPIVGHGRYLAIGPSKEALLEAARRSGADALIIGSGPGNLLDVGLGQRWRRTW
jgi:hypothetical protein